eukprot:Nitzschia sp. Nitz4//scaffold56_size114212//41724//42805//NITZ4_003943-RA/size114212-processed-gene-0.61-mRNA-1//-1//CDS//3329554685//9277//frame0
MASDELNDFFQANFPETPNDMTSTVEDFDPFHIGNQAKDTSELATVASKASNAIPPRMDVKFKVHEEVSSHAVLGKEGSSEVYVEGTVLALVASSDALKNSPFILVSTHKYDKLPFIPNPTYAKSYDAAESDSQINVVKIPKNISGFVKIGQYKHNQSVDHLPMLLEKKVTRSKEKIQVALQVRSKLTNPADLSEFSIALSMSEKVASDSVEVNVGIGEWDRMTRTIVWKLDRLPKGESFMVSARAKLTQEFKDLDTAELDFPVMMRCRCNDQISKAAFQAVEATGFPATITSSTTERSYRIIHRLP